MPRYGYVCVTLQGDWLEGQQEAVDKNDLSSNLQKDGLTLVSWTEIPADAPVSAAEPKAITQEEGRARWSLAPESQRLVPQLEALAKLLPSIPRLGFLGWIQEHTGGAVTNAAEALLVLAVSGGFLASFVYISLNGLPFLSHEPEPLKLPPVVQLDMSVKKVKDQFRRIKTYRLEKAHAADAKRALDHVMRQSSMTSELATSLDNALVVKATALDLELIDTLIPGIDKDFGEMTENQTTITMVEMLMMLRNKWLSQPHATPKLTPEEEQELVLEKNQ